jgi:hypothetical protein
MYIAAESNVGLKGKELLESCHLKFFYILFFFLFSLNVGGFYIVMIKQQPDDK